MENDKAITFIILEGSKFQCPFCKQLFLSIKKHIGNKNCKINQLNIGINKFKSQLDSFREGFRLELSRKKNRRAELSFSGKRVLKSSKLRKMHRKKKTE